MLTITWYTFRIFIYDIQFYLYGFLHQFCWDKYIDCGACKQPYKHWRNRAQRCIDRREEILEEQFELKQIIKEVYANG